MVFETINQDFKAQGTKNQVLPNSGICCRPGGNLTCLWYGVVPFLGYLFMILSGFMGMVFNNFLHLPDLWV